LKKHIKSTAATLKELEAQRAALRRLLELEQARSAGYQMMIKLAEEKFGIQIGKEIGTK
jgi:hypothetical protein